MDARGTAFVVAALLWGVFLLGLQVPLLLALAVTASAFGALLVTRLRMDWIGLVVYANFALWMFSGLWVGSLKLSDMATFPFINGEGRIFVAYMPLLFLSVTPIRELNLQSLFAQLRYLAFATLAMLAVWVLTHTPYLSEGASGNFVGFLTSHTGGGTVFGLLALTLIIFGFESRRLWTQLIGWAMIFPLLASASREALLALLVAGVWYLIKLRKWRAMLLSSVLVLLIVVITPVVAPHTWARTANLFTWSLVDSVIETVETSTWEPGDSDVELEGRQQNVLTRIAFWTYSLKRFAESPIFGIGWGRYNDSHIHQEGIPGLFYPAVDGHVSLSVGNAHNSFIHVMCENGLLGLGLLLWLWLGMYWRLSRAARRYAALKDAHSLFMAGQGVVVFSLIAALTGHALAAPSLVLPATTVLGVALAYQRFLARAEVRSPIRPQAVVSAMARV